MSLDSQIILYHANMAAMIKLGEWFDYLKKMNVYDNTRIIIVADHGYNIGQPDMYFCEGSAETDLDNFYPLLMVKDFDAKGFDTSEEFMTNADVPSLSVKGLIDDPVNPFTGKEINDSEKHAHDQFVIDSQDWSPDENNGDQFRPGDWYSVHDDMRNKANWKLIAKDKVYTGE